MRMPALVIALVLGLSASAAGQEWDLYTSIQDGFKINFPGQPRVTESIWTSQLDFKLPARIYSADKGDEHYSVTVAIVDRAGDLKLLLRADNSNPHNADLARRKAYTARTFGVTSTEFRNRTTGDGELTGQRYLAEVVPLGGGLPIMVGTERIGGLGLSGAPDQAADEKCARAGLAAAASSLK